MGKEVVEAALKYFIRFGHHGNWNEVTQEDYADAWKDCGRPDTEESGAFEGTDSDIGTPVYGFVGSRKPKKANDEEE